MKRIKWLTGLFILVLILIVVIANLGLGSTYFTFIYNIPGLDKIGHFFLMGILSFLVNFLLKAKKVQILSFSFLRSNPCGRSGRAIAAILNIPGFQLVRSSL